MTASLEDNRRVRLGEYRQAIRRHAPSELLPQVARIASQLKEYEFDPKWNLYSPWAAAAIARDSLLFASEHRSAPADVKALKKIFRLFAQAENGVPQDTELWLMMTAFIYEQGHYQDTPLHDISRTLLLLKDTQISAPEIPDRDWKEVLGVELEQWLMALFAISTATKGALGLFDANSPERDNWEALNPVLTKEVIDACLQRLVCTPTEFREKSQVVPKVAPHLARFAFNQLNSTPFIDFGAGPLVAPQYLLLLRSMLVENIFYRATEKWKLFPEELGYRVEAYTGRQLEYAGFDNISPEIVYGPEKKKSVDWILTHGNVLLLVECKAAKQSLDVRAGGLGALDFLSSRIGKARDQIRNTLALIEDGQPEFTRYRGFEAIGLIVTAEPVHSTNETMFTQGLPPTNCPTLVVSLKELEILCHLGSEEMVRTLQVITGGSDANIFSVEHAIRQIADPAKMATHNLIIEDAFDRTLGSWAPPMLELSDSSAP